MLNTFILLGALFLYPVITYLFLQRTKNKPRARKLLFTISFITVALVALGLLLNISFTISVVDWFLLTSFYFVICLVFWWFYMQSSIISRIIGGIGLVLFCGTGYLIAVYGFLGIGFVVGRYETHTEKWLPDGLIYKDQILGNALTDFRGKRVEVYRTCRWLPLLEKRIAYKDYYNWIVYMKQINVQYDPVVKQFNLTASAEEGTKDLIRNTWSDTLKLP
ncbi:MAG: hypothetical protein QM731_10425 [Chitinophagaceae bacterium]